MTLDKIDDRIEGKRRKNSKNKVKKRISGQRKRITDADNNTGKRRNNPKQTESRQPVKIKKQHKRQQQQRHNKPRARNIAPAASTIVKSHKNNFNKTKP